jgi:hypothetical protein
VRVAGDARNSARRARTRGNAAENAPLSTAPPDDGSKKASYPIEKTAENFSDRKRAKLSIGAEFSAARRKHSSKKIL